MASTDEGVVKEDTSHNLYIFKLLDVIVKWYSTTDMIKIQGEGHRALKKLLAFCQGNNGNNNRNTSGCNCSESFTTDEGRNSAPKEVNRSSLANTFQDAVAAYDKTNISRNNTSGIDEIKEKVVTMEMKLVELQARVNMLISPSSPNVANRQNKTMRSTN